jgi:hypothetical protein
MSRLLRRFSARLAADTNTPDCRALFEIIPGELIGTLRLELTAQWSRIVIGNQDKTLARLQHLKGSENKRMTLARNDLANVQ